MSSSTITSIHDLHKFVDGKNRKTPFPVDSITGSLVTIGYTHHEIHEQNGYSFFVKNYSVANSGTYAITIEVPTGMTFHLKQLDPWINNAHGEIDFIQAPSSYSGGTTVVAYNRHTGSSATSGITIKRSATFAGGTIKDTLTFGGGGANVASRTGGPNNTEIEWILNSATVFVLNERNLSGTSATISFRATGYKE